MSAEIIDLPVMTKLDVPTENVLRGAMEKEPREVVVIGLDKDGEFFFASSTAHSGDVMYHLAMAKKKLLDLMDK